MFTTPNGVMVMLKVAVVIGLGVALLGSVLSVAVSLIVRNPLGALICGSVGAACYAGIKCVLDQDI